MLQKFFKKFILSTVFGTGIGILSSAILIFLMAAALTVGNIPVLLISPITVIFLAFGGFFAGFSSAKLSGEKGLLCGFVSGILFFAVAWICGAVFEKAGFGTSAAIKALMIIISGSLGGILGVNYKRK
ncbi:MAG: TIGR04086 family membrane protein [Oscillospiraceae bacterium]|nr:TIGR04086 family membrane protein [Oscillospiraceae bacterium]